MRTVPLFLTAVTVALSLACCERAEPMPDFASERRTDTVSPGIETRLPEESSNRETETVPSSETETETETQPYRLPPGSNQYINALTFDTVADMKRAIDNKTLSENNILDITLGGMHPEHLEVDTDNLYTLAGLPDPYYEAVVEWHGGHDYDVAYAREKYTPILAFTPFSGEEALTSWMESMLKRYTRETVVTEYKNAENGVRYALIAYYGKDGTLIRDYLCAYHGDRSFLVTIHEDVIAQEVLFSLTAEKV